MLATSWNATGLVRPVWQRLGPPYAREKLAERTGIKANDLSSLNRGRRPMTMALATRIASAVDGITVYDLGAPSVEDGEIGPRTVLQRLEAVEARQVKAAGYLKQVYEALGRAGIDVPVPPSDDPALPGERQPDRTPRRKERPGGQA